jgi:hypothetical protein
MFIVWSKECNDCGGDTAIKKFIGKPTQEDIREVELAVGGGW